MVISKSIDLPHQRHIPLLLPKHTLHEGASDHGNLQIELRRLLRSEKVLELGFFIKKTEH